MKKATLVSVLLALFVSFSVLTVGSLTTAHAFEEGDFIGTNEVEVVVGEDEEAILNIGGSLNEKAYYTKELTLDKMTLSFDISGWDKNYEGTSNMELGVYFTNKNFQDAHFSSGNVLDFYFKKTTNGNTNMIISFGGSSHSTGVFGVNQAITSDVVTISTYLYREQFLVNINGSAYCLDKNVATSNDTVAGFLYNKTPVHLAISSWAEANWSGGGKEQTIKVLSLTNTINEEDFSSIEFATGWNAGSNASASFVGESSKVKLSIKDSWGTRVTYGTPVNLSSIAADVDLSGLDTSDGNTMNTSMYFAVINGDHFSDGNGGLNFFIHQNGDKNYTVKLSLGSYNGGAHDSDMFNLGAISITGTDELSVKIRVIKGDLYVNVNGTVNRITPAMLDALNASSGIKAVFNGSSNAYLVHTAWNDAGWPNGNGVTAEIVYNSITTTTSNDDFISIRDNVSDTASALWNKNAYEYTDNSGKVMLTIQNAWGERACKFDSIDLADMELVADLSLLDYYSSPMEAAFYFTNTFGDYFTDGHAGLDFYVNKNGNKNYTLTISLGSIGSYQHNSDVFGVGTVSITDTDIISIKTSYAEQTGLTVTVNGVVKVIDSAVLSGVTVPAGFENLISGQADAYLTVAAWTGANWPGGNGQKGVIILEKLEDANSKNYAAVVYPAYTDAITAFETAIAKDLTVEENYVSSKDAYEALAAAYANLRADDKAAASERVDSAIASYVTAVEGSAVSGAGVYNTADYSYELRILANGNNAVFATAQDMSKLSVTIGLAEISEGATVTVLFGKGTDTGYAIKMTKTENGVSVDLPNLESYEVAGVSVKINVIKGDTAYNVKVGTTTATVAKETFEGDINADGTAILAVKVTDASGVEFVGINDLKDGVINAYLEGRELALAYLEAFEGAVAAIDSYDTLVAAYNIYTLIPENYADYFGEEEADAIAGRIATAYQVYEALVETYPDPSEQNSGETSDGVSGTDSEVSGGNGETTGCFGSAGVTLCIIPMILGAAIILKKKED